MIPPSWGITNLVLIPKIAHLELITQFHPISLCNTFTNWCLVSLFNSSNPIWQRRLTLVKLGLCRAGIRAITLSSSRRWLGLSSLGRVRRGMLHLNWILKKLMIGWSGIIFRKRLNSFNCLPLSSPSSWIWSPLLGSTFFGTAPPF